MLKQHTNTTIRLNIHIPQSLRLDVLAHKRVLMHGVG